MPSLQEDFLLVKNASRSLIALDDARINKILVDLADTLVTHTSGLLQENKKDLDRMDQSNPLYDRLLLTEERVLNIANDIRNVASLPSPLDRMLDEKKHHNGMTIQKTSCPIGVIGVIYEARPNVTFDVFSLSFKSGNAVALKGGRDASFSNIFSVQLIQDVLQRHNVDPSTIYLLSHDRQDTKVMIESTDFIDMIIPRGSKKLIEFVRDNSKVPVIETGAGICHTYVDATCGGDIAKDIVYNAKTRRVSVCNALDCLLIHRDKLCYLDKIIMPLADKQVEVFACPESFALLQGTYPYLYEVDKDSFGTEFLSLKMSLKVVSDIQEALDHITRYSSKHSECIVSNDQKNIDIFLRQIDAACVYANVSTAFSDGAQFGLGAEIGISTQKMHARGPMGLQELTSYKWVIRGDGQIRG